MSGSDSDGLNLLNQKQNQNPSKLPLEHSIFNLQLIEHTVNSIREALIVTDMSNNILFVNNAFLKMYGYTKEELLGKNIEVIRSKRNDPKILKELFEATRKGGWKGELYNKKKNGEEFIISLKSSIVKDEDGKPVALVGAVWDMTDQLQQEETIMLTEQKYRTLFRELKDAVYESTPDGRLIDINPAGVEFFGYDSKDELLKADIAKDLYLNETDRARFKEKLESEGYVKNYEIEIKNKQGQNLTVLETASAVKDANGNIVLYRGILRDITESKRNEILLKQYVEQLASVNNQLQESENELRRLNKEKDKFFSIIAHDLKSPFNALYGLSQFLAEDIEELTKEEIKTFATEINLAAHNVFKLLENLLQWSRIQTGRMEQYCTTIDMQGLINESFILLNGNASKKQIKLQSNIDREVFAFADRNMISSVIQNLISNAIKFSNTNDSITIDAAEYGREVLISIADTGIGMGEDVKEKLFKIDCHHTTPGTENEAGTGLGLILCKELVEKNSGKIWVESQKGVGTTFFFTLPKK